MKRLVLLALPALTLACLLILPEPSFAQRGGGGGRGGAGMGRGYGGRGYGYGGRGYGGYGGYGYGGFYPGFGLGIGYGGWDGGYYSSPGYYSQPYAYSAPASGYPAAGYQSLYPPSGTTQPSTMPGYVHIRVPADAKVFFDDTPTTETGPDRMFVTPPLDPNQNYSYEISARWMDNGQERKQTRTVRPMPGQTVDVNFMSPGK